MHLRSVHVFRFPKQLTLQELIPKLHAMLPGNRVISFSISPYIVNKAKATPLSGAYPLTTITSMDLKPGLNYHININNSYSLIIGLHGGGAATNYKLFIRESDFNPSLSADVDMKMGPTTGDCGFLHERPNLDRKAVV